ncbi:MAG TPA: glutamate racemase [Bacteroidales bacterium]|jgi:glutamate racemase|nr:glutamate racemase [Bacteroidales bacterium]HPK29995.1 glutamate racemase [Bacteroidales bacterium]
MIGIFDSGVGGLSVWREIFRLMPGESYLYISDGAFCPYGPKDPEFIRERSAKISAYLIGKGAEIIVVACNTATAAAISSLRENFALPFVGMEPAIKPAALHSKSGVVGVLATAGTFRGRLYLDTLARFAGDVRVVEQVGEGLVEAIERGVFDSPAIYNLLHHHIDGMVAAGADHIVLGCTHYPFVEEAIAKIAGPEVVIVNPAPAVAAQTMKVLSQIREISGGIGESFFYSTGEISVLKMLVRHEIPDMTDSHFTEILI